MDFTKQYFFDKIKDYTTHLSLDYSTFKQDFLDSDKDLSHIKLTSFKISEIPKELDSDDQQYLTRYIKNYLGDNKITLIGQHKQYLLETDFFKFFLEKYGEVKVSIPTINKKDTDNKFSLSARKACVFHYMDLDTIEKLSLKDLTYKFPLKCQVAVIDHEYILFWDFACFEGTITEDDLVPEFDKIMAQGILYKSFHKVKNLLLVIPISEITGGVFTISKKDKPKKKPSKPDYKRIQINKFHELLEHLPRTIPLCLDIEESIAQKSRYFIPEISKELCGSDTYDILDIYQIGHKTIESFTLESFHDLSKAHYKATTYSQLEKILQVAWMYTKLQDISIELDIYKFRKSLGKLVRMEARINSINNKLAKFRKKWFYRQIHIKNGSIFGIVQ